MTTALNWALVASVIFSIYFGVRFYFRTHEIRALQSQLMTYQNNRAIASALANEALEYGKRNAAINPILQSVGLNTASAPKPAGK